MATSMASVWSAAAALLCCLLLAVPAAQAVPTPPEPCGTLDLTSPLTQHCFPEDGECTGCFISQGCGPATICKAVHLHAPGSSSLPGRSHVLHRQ